MPYKDKKKQREYQRKWKNDKYSTDGEYRKSQQVSKAKSCKTNLDKGRALVTEFRKNGCKKCDEKDPDCLCAHHKNPKLKKFSLGKLASIKPTPAKVKAELKKCTCLCFNCHAKLHARLRKLEKKKEISSGKKKS